jgi:hypothetical protein
MASSEREIAIQQQEKFEFYALSLVFTLLALSVQSAELGDARVKDCVELGAWVALLISGLAGLSYLQMNPVVRSKMALKDEFDEEVKTWRTAQLSGNQTFINSSTGEEQPIAPLLTNRLEAIQTLIRVISRLETRQRYKYLLFTYGFVAGVVLVAVSRALPAFSGSTGVAI